MKIATTVVLLSLLACSSALADEFTTSKGLRSTPSLGGLDSESSLQQAQQAGLATLAELMADADAVDKEGPALLGEAASLRQKVADERAALDPVRAHFDAANKKYLADLAAYNARSQDLAAEVARQQAEAVSLNSVVSAQRDQATVERLNKWAADLDARRNVLETERAALDEQQASVEGERQNVAKLEVQANAKLKALSDALQAKYAARKGRQTAVYGELRRCAAYVGKVRDLLKTKFNVASAPLPLLNGAIARIRDFDNRVR